MSSHSGPFVAEWIDGRKETIPDVMTILDDEHAAEVWADHRARGAVTLWAIRDGDNSKLVDHNYTRELMIKIGMSPGAHVRHKRHPELTGRVVGLEVHSSGKLSAIPLKVYWDQENAPDVLGFFWIYQSPEDLELIPAEVVA